MAVSLIGPLKAQLQARRDLWSEWSREEREKCDQLAQSHEAERQKYQSQIDNTAQELLALQLEQQCDLQDAAKTPKQPLCNKADSEDRESPSSPVPKLEELLQEELIELETSLSEKRERLKELRHEATREEERAKDAQALHQEVQDSAESTLFHLNKAADQYSQFVGLEFKKAPNDQLQFVFTQLDSNNPKRPFSFSLAVDEDDLYQLRECDPLIKDCDGSTANLSLCVQNLNETMDMRAFLLAMRRAFARQITSTLPQHQ